jgi:hypothetical protein
MSTKKAPKKARKPQAVPAPQKVRKPRGKPVPLKTRLLHEIRKTTERLGRLLAFLGKRDWGSPMEVPEGFEWTSQEAPALTVDALGALNCILEAQGRVDALPDDFTIERHKKIAAPSLDVTDKVIPRPKFAVTYAGIIGGLLGAQFGVISAIEGRTLSVDVEINEKVRTIIADRVRFQRFVEAETATRTAP